MHFPVTFFYKNFTNYDKLLMVVSKKTKEHVTRIQ